MAGELLSTVDTAVTLFTAGLRTEITRILIADVSTTPAATSAVTIHHVPSGETTGDDYVILIGGVGVLTESQSEGSGITLAPGDILTATPNIASALVCTLYGTTENIVGRI